MCLFIRLLMRYAFNVLIYLVCSSIYFNPVYFHVSRKDQFHVQPYILVYNSKIRKCVNKEIGCSVDPDVAPFFTAFRNIVLIKA